MNNRLYLIVFGLMCFLTSSPTVAQDSIPLFQSLRLKSQSENLFNTFYYYNPANMSGYSSYSTSLFEVKYASQNNALYLLQEGKEQTGLEVYTSSYKKLKNNRSIWGHAKYVNQKHKDVQWNDNIDTKEIAPYVMADSTAGTMKYEAYEFAGGYTKQFERWKIGSEFSYNAHMGYRAKDPRPKNISSLMRLKVGATYQIYKDWAIGGFGEVNKYTQNTSVKFANQTQQASLYQMQGMGEWNYYFSGKVKDVIFERFGYVGGVEVSNKDGRDFVVGMQVESNNLRKNISGSGIGGNDALELNRLSTVKNKFYVAKFFDLSEATRIGLKYQYYTDQRKGIDNYYSNIDKKIEKLLEKQNYQNNKTSHLVEGYFHLLKDNYTIRANPFVQIEESKEKVKESNKYQNYSYAYVGVKGEYSRALNSISQLSVKPYIAYRKVVKEEVNLGLQGTKEPIQSWLLNDYEYYKTDYITWGVSTMYSLQQRGLPFYVSVDYNQVKFKTEKDNNYIGFTIGVMF
ncbi:MAG: hypothetical protein LBI72_09975 [Flavobacteriaceae bacterium]|nr:hypothetical protein [Flavobacteriaceae bacterium]